MSASDSGSGSDSETEEDFSLANQDVVTKYRISADIADIALGGVVSMCTVGKTVVEICKTSATV